MKITDMKIEKVTFSQKNVINTALGFGPPSIAVYVKLETDSGIYGFGEAGGFLPVTGENDDIIVNALSLIKSRIIGMDPFAIEQIHFMMDSTIAHNTSAKAAVDIAAYDIMSRASGQPLYKFLGGFSNTVETDMTIGIDTAEKMACDADKFVNGMGFRVLKIKTGIDLDADIENIRAIRAVAGDKVELHVDANQGYNRFTAARAIEEFAKLGVTSIEQPLPCWDVEGLAQLKHSTHGLIIMSDESVFSPIDAAKACRADAVHQVNIKLMKCGGLFKAKQIDAICRANGVTCMVGCMNETDVSCLAGLALVASSPNIVDADLDSFVGINRPAIIKSSVAEVINGIATLPDVPGLGVELDM